jgi:hypothetical protein
VVGHLPPNRSPANEVVAGIVSIHTLRRAVVLFIAIPIRQMQLMVGF